MTLRFGDKPRPPLISSPTADRLTLPLACFWTGSVFVAKQAGQESSLAGLNPKPAVAMDTKKMIMAGLIIAIGLGVGVLIGHYAVPHAPKAAKDHKPLVGTTTPATAGASDALKALLEDVKKTPAQGGFVKRLVHAIDSAKIEEHLKFLAAEPHVAGTQREENVLANYIKEKFTEYGLDFVKIASYDVLLSYPNVSDPNTVQVLNISSGEVFFDAATQEDVIPGVNSDIGPAFLAYSPPNDVLGNLVYVNYGTNEDFDMLQQMGVDINGAVCLTRYGNGYRGQKVRNCAARGGVGALLFLDPEQVAREGLDNVFPNSTWMPDTAMQRGSLMSVGDPMTPGVPALRPPKKILVQLVSQRRPSQSRSRPTAESSGPP
ncbi:aminopeptidase NAALADL1 [Ixodes scapularis]